MKKEFIETGKISSVVGLKGEVKITPWADSPDFLCDFSEFYSKDGLEKFIVEKIRTQKNTVVAKFINIDTPEAATALRGTVLYINRNDVVLDDNEYFIQDLIGCCVKDADNDKIYGTIDDVTKTGANDVYHIKTDDDKILLVPVIDSVVLSKDVDNGIIIIRPLEGLFDEN